MNEAVDLGYTTNMQFKHRKFVVSTEDTDAVLEIPLKQIT